MAVKAATIAYEDVEKLFAVPTKELASTKLFLEGDHWQKHEGWVGWRPATESETSAQDWTMIEQGFTPKNVVRGMVKRLTGAVMGKQPDWEVVPVGPSGDGQPSPKPAEKPAEWKKIDEILNRWWTSKKVHESLKEFIWNKASYGKSAIRIYIPAGYIKETNDGLSVLDVQNASDLEEILDKIYIDAPGYECVTDAEDPEYGECFTAISQKRDPDKPTEEKFFELCYVDTDGKTYLRQVSQSTTKTESASDKKVSINLGGNLLVFVDGEYTDAMISTTVKAQQRQLNHANTMEGYSMANINFPPIYFTNAVTDIEEKDTKGKTVKKKAGLVAGVGRWINLIGVTIQTAAGDENLKDPSITFQPQGKPEDFAKVAANKARDMHEEAGMLYVFLADNPYPSGDSRIEAMTDYLILLVDYKTLCDALGSWLIQTVLRLAFNLTGQTAKNDQFSVIFSTNLTIGRITRDDKDIMLREVQQGLRSRRNYMIKAEVTDDPETELTVIKADPPMPVATGPFGQPTGGAPSANGNPPKPAPAPAK